MQKYAKQLEKMPNNVVEYRQNKNHVEAGRNTRIAVEETSNSIGYRDWISKHKTY